MNEFKIDGQKWLDKTFAKGYLKMSRTTFSLSGLEECVQRNDYRGYTWRTFDHLQYVKCGRYPFALISHPYDTKKRIGEEMSRIQSLYPLLVAWFIDEESWWNDGCIPYILMRRDDLHRAVSLGAYCTPRLATSDRRR